MYAFRCKSCGHLCRAEHAGEKNFPYACPVCRVGIVFAHSIEELKEKRPELFVGLSDTDVRARTYENKVAEGVSIIHFAVHENWEVLADCTPERLKELEKDHGEPLKITRHVPFKTMWKFDEASKSHVASHAPVMEGSPPKTTGTHHDRTAADSQTSSDKAVSR